MFFIGKRLNHTDASDIILDPGIEAAHIAEKLMIGAGHVAAEVDDNPGHERNNNEGDNRQLEVDIGH
ncbi:hypothetical protein D3C87_1619030 [compost metagenome]